MEKGTKGNIRAFDGDFWVADGMATSFMSCILVHYVYIQRRFKEMYPYYILQILNIHFFTKNSIYTTQSF